MGENVRQVLDYVARGEVDAGIVYATAVQVAPLERYGQIKISPVKEKTFKIMAPGYEWRTFWDSFPDSDGLSMPDEFLANVSYEWDNPRKSEKSELSFDIKSLMGMKWIGGPTIEESLQKIAESVTSKANEEIPREIASSVKDIAEALKRQAKAKRQRDA
jgi:hypothetical protein